MEGGVEGSKGKGCGWFNEPYLNVCLEGEGAGFEWVWSSILPSKHLNFNFSKFGEFGGCLERSGSIYFKNI